MRLVINLLKVYLFFRLCLFWVKIIFGNAFLENFRKCGCLVGLENRIFRKLISVDPKKRLWLRKWISVPIFTSNEFPRERERERERARAREGDRDPVDAVRTSKLQLVPFTSTSTIDRDPRSRTHLRADCDRRGA